MQKIIRAVLILVVLPFYTSAQSNRCSIKLNGKVGYIDTLGHVIIEPQFQGGSQFSEDVACVRLNGKCGAIDTTGKFIVEPKFTVLNQFFDGHAAGIIDSHYCLIDKTGKYLLKPKYERIYFQSEHKVGVKQNGLWAFYDVRRKKFITKFQFTDIGAFQSGLAKVGIAGLYGFIDSTGAMVIPPIYRQVMFYGFCDNRAAVVDNKTGKWGYIDKTGKETIPFEYFSASTFREGKAFVKIKWNEPGYFIDTLGNKLFDKTFDKAWGFSENRCGVTINEKNGIIDEHGNWVVEPVYHWINIFYHNGWIAFSSRDSTSGISKWGLLDHDGNEIFSAQFACVVQNDGDCVLPEVYSGNCSNDVNLCAKGYVNTRGEIIWSPTE